MACPASFIHFISYKLLPHAKVVWRCMHAYRMWSCMYRNSSMAPHSISNIFLYRQAKCGRISNPPLLTKQSISSNQIGAD